MILQHPLFSSFSVGWYSRGVWEFRGSVALSVLSWASVGDDLVWKNKLFLTWNSKVAHCLVNLASLSPESSVLVYFCCNPSLYSVNIASHSLGVRMQNCWISLSVFQNPVCWFIICWTTTLFSRGQISLWVSSYWGELASETSLLVYFCWWGELASESPCYWVN